MAERELVQVMNLTVCENGHTVDARPTGEEAWMIRCGWCKGWAWEDGNFCGNCGTALDQQHELKEVE